MMGKLIREVNYDRHIIEIDKREFPSYSAIQKNFDLIFENPTEITKKELLANIEIKLHKELGQGYVKGIANRKLCKIKDKWFSLRDIKNIIPKQFIIYDFSDDKAYLKISNMEKTIYLIIAGFIFSDD